MSSTRAAGDDFGTAVRQLQALNSVTEAGLPLDEYQRRVLDAKIIIDRYLARPDGDAKRRSAVARSIGLYVKAANSWRYSITGTEPPSLPDDCPPARDFVIYVIKESTDHLRQIGPGPALELIRSQYKTAVPMYWSCASDWARTAQGAPEPHYPPFIPPQRPSPTPPPAVAPGFRPRVLPADGLEENTRRKIDEEKKTRPFCAWAWNGSRWVTRCTPVGTPDGQCERGGVWNEATRTCDY